MVTPAHVFTLVVVVYLDLYYGLKDVDFLTYAPGISALASACAAGFSFWAVMRMQQSIGTARDASMGQTLTWCMEKYLDLEDKRANNSLTGERYFELLWSLHFAEFYLYQRGLLPEPVYVRWLFNRHQLYNDPESKANVGDKTQQEGWQHASGVIADPQFVNFINQILQVRRSNGQPLHGTDKIRELVRAHFGTPK
jgi:hypothetical protein